MTCQSRFVSLSSTVPKVPICQCSPIDHLYHYLLFFALLYCSKSDLHLQLRLLGWSRHESAPAGGKKSKGVRITLVTDSSMHVQLSRHLLPQPFSFYILVGCPIGLRLPTMAMGGINVKF